MSKPYAIIGTAGDLLRRIPPAYQHLLKKTDPDAMPGVFRIVDVSRQTILLYNIVTGKTYDPVKLVEMKEPE